MYVIIYMHIYTRVFQQQNSTETNQQERKTKKQQTTDQKYAKGINRHVSKENRLMAQNM